MSGKKLQAQGVRQFQLDEFEAAAQTFQEAITAFEAENDPLTAAEQRVNLGLAYRALDRFDAAIEAMQTGLETFRQHQDRFREAQALGNLALVYAKQDNSEQATTYYREAANIFRELGEDEFYGQTILALADLQFRSGQMVQAAETFELGLKYIENPNQRQKMMKQLMVVKNRMLGGGAPAKTQSRPALRSEAADDDDEDED